jgi:carboxymethylenebutenolidase
MRETYIHVHSMRAASGHEVLVCRALARDGAAGFGFSFQLEATQARHMAMFEAGLWPERPRIRPETGHPWETAWLAGKPVPWEAEPAFSKLEWNGYLAEPAQAQRAPGMVVIQEWWGLNDQIKGVAERLAKSGYRALVPDLYRGKVTLEAKEAEHLMNGLNFGEAAGQDIRGAVQYLKKDSPKAGVTGFCMGGALTLLAAVHVPESDANVVWYGYPPLEYVDAGKISGVDELEQKLREANVKYEFYRYKAKHAFANETADAAKLAMLQYNKEAAELAWRRTMEFLERHLKS